MRITSLQIMTMKSFSLRTALTLLPLQKRTLEYHLLKNSRFMSLNTGSLSIAHFQQENTAKHIKRGSIAMSNKPLEIKDLVPDENKWRIKRKLRRKQGYPNGQ